jgi:hypothetical protein
MGRNRGSEIMKAILIVLAFATTAASAQTGTVGPKAIPGQTREEKLFAIRDALKAMDTNGDSKVTETEWTTAGGKPAGFATLDTNRDSILTVQELRSNARKLRAFEDFEAAAPY